MFLKINFQDKMKKVKFQDKYLDLDEFKDFIEDLTKCKYENLEVFFLDSEDDKIKIQDIHDLEYFVDQYSSEKFAELKIEKISSNENILKEKEAQEKKSES